METITSKNINIFFKGGTVLPKEVNSTTEGVSKYLDSLLERAEKGHKIDLIFDIDGTLAELSLESARNPKTLDTWAQENKDSIDLFKRRIKSLQRLGRFRMGISTGRGWEFTKRFTDILFPQDSLDYVIAEGGAIVASKPDQGEEWKIRPAKSVDKESLAVLNKYRERVIDEAKKIGAVLERHPKIIRLTLNPPAGMTGEELTNKIKAFFLQLGEENPEDKEMLRKLSNNMSNTPTTSESMPFGVDKQSGIKEMAGENITIYFGDANTDLPAMERANINVVPSNADPDIKEFTKGNQGTGEFIGLLASHPNLTGVIGALRTIELHYRRLDMRTIGKKKQVKPVSSYAQYF